MKRQHIMCAIVTALLVCERLHAQDAPESFGPKPTGASAAQEQYEANLKAHQGNPDMLVLPGLVADRTNRVVSVLAEYTGVRAEEAIEYLLIAHDSSHGYESAFWVFARPSDVQRALEFIGLEAGPPVNPVLPGFWSSGDRVNLSIQRKEGDAFPIEQTIRDTETGDAIPEEGFALTGSMVVPLVGATASSGYAADDFDPKAVASIYNEPAAVLNVPRPAPKGEVYGQQVISPDPLLKGGELLTVVMKPRDPAGRSRVPAVNLRVDGAPGGTGLVCRLTDAGGATLCETSGVIPVLEHVMAMKQDGPAPSIGLSFGDGAPVAEVAKASLLLLTAETLGFAALKPPADGQIYYRAFVPDKGWAKPEGRPSQPWELHLGHTNGTVQGEMVWHEPDGSDEKGEPSFKRHAYPAPEPAAVTARLDADMQEQRAGGAWLRPAALLVFAAPGLSYGEVMKFAGPAVKLRATVYVFVKE